MPIFILCIMQSRLARKTGRLPQLSSSSQHLKILLHSCSWSSFVCQKDDAAYTLQKVCAADSECRVASGGARKGTGRESGWASCGMAFSVSGILGLRGHGSQESGD